MENKDISNFIGKKVNFSAWCGSVYVTFDGGTLQKEGDYYIILSQTKDGAAAVSFSPEDVEYFRENNIYIYK